MENDEINARIEELIGNFWRLRAASGPCRVAKETIGHYRQELARLEAMKTKPETRAQQPEILN